MSALQLRDAIAQGQLSPVEVVEATFELQDLAEPHLNCFVTRTPDLALAAARRAEKMVLAGEPLGPLHGLPISVKDNLPVGDVLFTSGSRALADNIAPADAVVVERARNAGACIVGKTTTSEFGCKPVGDSPLSGVTRNPWNLAKTPGGSSAGAAASVAAGVTPFAIATDGGGSIRIPAAFSGLFGIKAQFGRVAVHPLPAVPSLLHIGSIARSVRDAALLLSVQSGHDARDPCSLMVQVPDYLAACETPVTGMRVAWSPTLGYGRPDPEVLNHTERAARLLETMGCSVEEVDVVLDADPIDIWVDEFVASAGTRLKPILEKQADLMDPTVYRMLSVVDDISLGDYIGSSFRRLALRRRIDRFFQDFDILLTPTTQVTAFDVLTNAPPLLADSADQLSWIGSAYPFNLTGNPAASLPVGLSADGLPIGLQIVAGTQMETDIFRVASALEAELAFPRCPFGW